jgi:hypothetical protein
MSLFNLANGGTPGLRSAFIRKGSRRVIAKKIGAAVNRASE